MLISEASLQLVRLLVERKDVGSYRTTEWLNYLKDKPDSYLNMINFRDNFSSVDSLKDAIRSVYFRINGSDYSNIVINFVVGNVGEITAVYVLFTRELTSAEVSIIEDTLKVKLETKDTNVSMLVA
jgi:hypothetical protein